MRFEAIRSLWDRLRSSGGDAKVLDSDSFTDSERAVGRLILPALDDLRSARKLADDLLARTRALEVVLRLLPVAALVFDCDGLLLTSNDAARALFGGHGIPLEVMAKAMRALRTGIEGQAVFVEHPDLGVPSLRVVPAEVSERLATVDEPRVVFLVGSSQAPPVRSDILVTGLGLTRMQAEVVAHVAAGLSNRDIADALSLSPETIKKHLAAAYQKTGVSNRAGIVALAFGARLGRRRSQA